MPVCFVGHTHSGFILERIYVSCVGVTFFFATSKSLYLFCCLHVEICFYGPKKFKQAVGVWKDTTEVAACVAAAPQTFGPTMTAVFSTFHFSCSLLAFFSQTQYLLHFLSAFVMLLWLLWLSLIVSHSIYWYLHPIMISIQYLCCSDCSRAMYSLLF